MSNASYWGFALLLTAVVVWQLATGRALGSGWFRGPTRREQPAAYWFVVAVQGAILVSFLMTGRAWHVR